MIISYLIVWKMSSIPKTFPPNFAAVQKTTYRYFFIPQQRTHIHTGMQAFDF